MGFFLVSGVNEHEASVENHRKGFAYALGLAKKHHSDVRVLFPDMALALTQYLSEAIGDKVASKLCSSSSKKINLEDVIFRASWLGSVKSRSSFSEIVYLVIAPTLIELELLTKEGANKFLI
ncbi:hypothetical protein [Klebsiella grimontii]|uniref:hypothetical protein n=1 Tax=Klebsiella grimontii TaxID=2058152 RepID=UPI0015EAF658|nr:hypothetical protein [Klebsiella grimontii]QLT89270.1 hypothetical protein HV252_18815 [Klebsiella grimontii]